MTLTRRQLLRMGAALPAAAMAAGRFRWAICSETFEGMSFGGACQAARRTGYAGIEVAPSHLSADPASLSGSERRRFRGMIEQAGLEYAGTHSLLGAPKGLHLTTPDGEVRRKSWEYFRRLIELSADLGEQTVMVLGSSRQRAAVDGASVEEAVARLTEGLAGVAPAAEARRVTILLEPLAPQLCNVINTLEEAVAVVERIASPAVRTMFDTHNTPAETLRHDRLIEKYFAYIRHVHLNEMDGRYPGSGDYDFATPLRALMRLGYRGWLSVEVFDFQPDGETVARRAREFLRRLEEQIA